MASHGIKDKVAIVGMGCTHFGERWDKSADDLLVDAGLGMPRDDSGHRQRGTSTPTGSGTMNSGQSGMVLRQAAQPRLQARHPGTRTSAPPGPSRSATPATRWPAGAYDIVMATGVEKLKDTGFSGLVRSNAPGDGTAPEMSLTAPAAFSLLDPAYTNKYDVDPARMREAMTHVAWKNHYNGALNERAQFRKEVPKEKIEASPLVAGRLGVFDCSGVSDGAAAALIVRAEDAHKYTDRPMYVKALAMVAGPGSGRDRPRLRLHDLRRGRPLGRGRLQAGGDHESSMKNSRSPRSTTASPRRSSS